MISFKQTVSITEAFHFKTSRLGFLLLPPVSFEIISERWNLTILVYCHRCSTGLYVDPLKILKFSKWSYDGANHRDCYNA